MLYLAPCLDDVLLRITHVVERNIHRIAVVTQVDACESSAVDIARCRTSIIQIRSHVSVSVGDAKRRLKEILVARCRVHFPASLRHRTVACCVLIPLQIVKVGVMQELLAEISLIQATVRSHLQHEVDIIRRDADSFLVVSRSRYGQCQYRGCHHCK